MAIDRKEKILKAAIDLWVKDGAAFTRLSAVAKAAKVPAPLIHYYFQSEEDLHFEVTLRIRDEILAYHLKHLVKKTGAAEGFKEYLKGPLLWASHQPGHASIWFYFYYLATYHPRFKELNTQLKKTGSERITLMIYEGIEKGEFSIPQGMAVKDLTQEIQAQMNGYLLLFMTEKHGRDVSYYIELQENRILALLGVTSK
jgi:AcrR family transcriptional regulator